MSIFGYLSLVAFLVNVFLAFFIITKNSKVKLNQYHFLLASSSAIWSLGEFIGQTDMFGLTLIGSRISVAGVILTSFFLIMFFLVFTRNVLFNRVFILLLVLPAISLLTLNFLTNLIIAGRVSMFEMIYVNYEGVPGPLFYIMVGYMVLSVLGGMALVVYYYFKIKDKREKSQAGLLIISMMIPFVGGIPAEFILPLLGFEVMPLANILTTITAIIITYTIVKYGFMIITFEAAAEQIVKIMKDYLVVLDRKFNIVLINPAIRDVTGYKEEKIIGRPFKKLTVDADKIRKRTTEVKEVRDYETHIISKGEEKILVSADVSRFRNKKGRTLGFVVVMHDIRQVKKLLRDLKQNQSKLTGKVTELEKVNNMMIGREMRIMELKEKLNNSNENKS